MTEDDWVRLWHDALRRGERLIDLSAVHGWLCSKRADWERQGVTIDIRDPTHGRPKDSLTVEITSPVVVAALMVWDSGEWDLGVINHLTQDEDWSPYHPAHTLAVLTSRIESELQRLGITASADDSAEDRM